MSEYIVWKNEMLEEYGKKTKNFLESLTKEANEFLDHPNRFVPEDAIYMRLGLSYDDKCDQIRMGHKNYKMTKDVVEHFINDDCCIVSALMRFESIKGWYSDSNGQRRFIHVRHEHGTIQDILNLAYDLKKCEWFE